MDFQGLFKVQDVNSLIKMFAFSVQDRFEELDGQPRSVQNNYLGHKIMDDSEHLIRKYRSYITQKQSEIKYLQKFVVRINQILDFFLKRSSNQNVLVVAIQKVQQKLTIMVNSYPVNVEQLYTYVIQLAKIGFHVKKQPFIRERRGYSLKKMQVSSNQNSQKATQQLQELRLTSAANPQKRRPNSFISKTSTKQTHPKQTVETEIAKFYSILDIEIYNLQKIHENKDKTKHEKESLKQNQAIISAIQGYQKQYSIYSKKKEKVDTTLKQINRSIRPSINNWISRKIKMTDYCKRVNGSENILIS